MAKRKVHEEHENHERWLVSYADFITLLFAFFTVLYATSQQDVKKEKEFEQSVRQHFSGAVGFASPTGDSSDGSDSLTAIVPSIDIFAKRGPGTSEAEEYVRNRLRAEMAEEDLEDTVGDIRHDTAGVRIQLAASALFPSGSANLKETAIAPLLKIGELLKDSKRKIIIEGHTDDLPIKTARFPSNWELSAARATKIVRYLIQRHGIPAERLVAVAYADQKPVVPNDSESHRAKNRRIEVMIVTEDKAF